MPSKDGLRIVRAADAAAGTGGDQDATGGGGGALDLGIDYAAGDRRYGREDIADK